MVGHTFFFIKNLKISWRCFFLAFILIAIFVVGGFLIYQYWQSRGNEASFNVLLENCKNASDLSAEKKDCYINLGRSQNNLALCDRISDPYGGYGSIHWVAYCYGGVAVERKDGKVCRKLYSKNADILDSCYFTAAFLLDNPDICLLAPNEYTGGQTLCIAGMAAAKMNIDICEKLKGIGRCQCYMNLADISSDFGKKEIYEEALSRLERGKCFSE